jgi:hypothetical protein
MDDLKQIFNDTTKSELFNYINRQVNIRPPNIYQGDVITRTDALGSFHRVAMYKSQQFILNDIKVPQPSLIAKDFTREEIIDMKNDLETYMNRVLIKELASQRVAYLNNNFYYPRGIYKVANLYNYYQEYGINNGKWDDSYTYFYEDGLKLLVDQFSFKILDNVEPFVSDKEFFALDDDLIWEIYMEQSPYLDIIDQRKKSGFPDFQPQSIENIIYTAKNWADIVKAVKYLVGTMYFRSQGGKYDFEQALEKIKIRVVVGSSLPVKMAGTPFTYTFKTSAPELSPYYKDTNVVLDSMLESFISVYDQKDMIAFTTDISGCDQAHNEVMLVPTMNKFLAKMRDDMDDSAKRQFFEGTTKYAFSAMKDPAIAWTIRQMQKRSKMAKSIMKSLSGNPLVPGIQTASVISSHAAGIGKTYDPKFAGRDLVDYVMSTLVKDLKCQIDDLYYAGARVNVLDVGDLITKQYGLRINGTKVETSDKGWITFLKNDMGYLYNESELGSMILLDGSNPDGTYTGEWDTKFQGTFDKERGNKDDGAPLFYLEEGSYDKDESDLVVSNLKIKDYKTGKSYFGVTKDVQQLIGILLSFTRKMPLELLDLYEFYFKTKPVWIKLLKLVKMIKHLKVVEKDFGFSDYLNLMTKIEELYG